MSSSSLFRFSGIVLLMGAVINIVLSIPFAIVFPVTGPGLTQSATTNAFWEPAWIAVFIATLLLVIGIPGLYLRQAAQAGVGAFIGVLLTTLGLLLASVAAPVFFIVMLPYLATQAPYLFNNAFNAGIAPFGPGGGLLLLIGLILLGIATIRAAVFPRLVGILILVGGILSPAAILATNLIVSLIGALSTILLMVAFGWIGLLLLRPGEASSTVSVTASS